MEVDFLIIGQGICGTFLSYYLRKEGKNCLVIDNNAPNTPSRISAGIINPVTGRRHVRVWMGEEILPFAWNAYSKIGKDLGLTLISQKNIIDFFPSPQMRQSFMQRVEEKDPHVHAYPEQNHFNHSFNYDFGCGEIRPAYTAHIELLLPAWRNELIKHHLLLEEDFDSKDLQIKKETIKYKDISARKIIFCDGNSSAANPFFQQLPFAPNKGEVLVADIPGLSDQYIYKRGMLMAPLATPGSWWVGSNYAWDFDNVLPTAEFRKRTEQLLKDWLRIPFTIMDHLSGIRPATLERRPFVGLHPLHPGIGIFNGMGTKGCSLAPFFAKQLARNLCYNRPIHPEADINRFQKILSRKES